jgi:capsular polysaccharide export protein
VARSVEALFVAAYLRYARYLDPSTGGPGEIEQVIEHLALQRANFEKNQGRLVCFGFRFWKRGYMQSYLRCPGNEVLFARNAKSAERKGLGGETRFLVWGQRETQEVRALADEMGIPLWRVEDGFLRSVGLGSDLAMPASLVFDQSGIYYDPGKASDLERILEESSFDDAERERARALRERIVDAGLSKYNVGGESQLPVPSEGRVVLVPGQVEDDASVQLGCRDVRTNLDLLRAAREASPDAFVIFKPHPDVLSGNRQGAVDEGQARRICDHVETGATLARCLDAADEIHTMTSLVGFEALLRGKRVVVYGQPFYSGWGLTEDRHPVPRRTRTLSLDELVAGTLIRYPRYLDRERGTFTTPEATIDQLLAERDATRDRRVEMTWLRRQLRKLAFAVRGIVHAP